MCVFVCLSLCLPVSVLALVVARIVLLFSGEFINPGPLAGWSSSNWSGSCRENGRQLGCYDRCLLHLGSPHTRLWGDRTALSQTLLFSCSLDWIEEEMFTGMCFIFVYFFGNVFLGLFLDSTLSVSTCMLKVKLSLHQLRADSRRLKEAVLSILCTHIKFWHKFHYLLPHIVWGLYMPMYLKGSFVQERGQGCVCARVCICEWKRDRECTHAFLSVCAKGIFMYVRVW